MFLTLETGNGFSVYFQNKAGPGTKTWFLTLNILDQEDDTLYKEGVFRGPVRGPRIWLGKWRYFY